jgi:hypothetical protein
MAKKPQTEEKAKGLLPNVGNYKGKTLNLSKKQLGASGTKASAARKIDISQTRYDKSSKKVLGPMGKPITGRVDLGGGNIAVYRNGVRVSAQKPQGKKTGGGGGGGGGGDKPAKRNYQVGPGREQGISNFTMPRPKRSMPSNPRLQSAIRRGEAAAERSGKPQGASGQAAGALRAGLGAPSRPASGRRTGAMYSKSGTRISMGPNKTRTRQIIGTRGTASGIKY